MRSPLHIAGLAATMVCVPLPGWGQPAEAPVIEEILVTAEFRRDTVERTPGSVSVVRLDDQKGRALNHLEDVLSQVPNVNLSGGSSRARFYQIRGIGERGQFDEPLNSSVGLLIDGVDFSGIGTVAVLHDVAQVEVLRGPQGTLYGANALAGLINVRTNDPTETFEGGVTLDAGNYDAWGLGLTVSGPLGDTLGGRLALRQYRDDGFYRNTFLDSGSTNDRDEQSIRGKLVWEPRDDLSLSLAGGYLDVANGYDAFSLDNDRRTRSDEPGQDEQRSAYGALSASWYLEDRFVLEAALAHASSEIDYGYDEDWTFVGFHPFGYSSTDRYLRDRDTTTFDARLLSGDATRLFGGSTEWLVGVYLLDQQVDFRREYTFLPGPFTSDFEIDRLALYGELSTRLGDSARLTLGLRGERHQSSYRDSEAVSFDPEDDLWGGRLLLEWDLSDVAMVYGGVTRGYKAGGFNPSSSLDADLRTFDPETLWNFEVGLKGRWLDDTLSGRFSVFSMQRYDVQIGTSIVRVRPDGSSEFIQLTDNAAEGQNNGIEVELRWTLTDGLTFFGSLGLLDTEFRDFVNSAGEDLDGEPQAHAPDYQFFVGLEYRSASGLFARLELEGRDAFYYSDSRRFAENADDLSSDPYELVNAALGFERERWEVRVWGRNLTDKDYTVRGFFFPNDPRDGYQERGWFQLGDPLRYGASLTLRL
jgi:iron complex outermembrane receptor protein